MYLEYILLIIDYYKTLNKRLVLYEICIPLLISIGLYFVINVTNLSLCVGFIKKSLPLLGILVGFSITIITILTTSHSRNIENIKNIKTKLKRGNDRITVYNLLIINFTYSVIIEIFLIIIQLIYPFFAGFLGLNWKINGFIFSVYLLIHVLLLTIRNLTDFYFIISKPEKRA